MTLFFSTYKYIFLIGTLIPQDINGIKGFQSSAKYILLIEKDAIFQKLLDEGALLRLGPVIILTVNSLVHYIFFMIKRRFMEGQDI